MRRLFSLYMLLLVVIVGYAQTDRQHIRQGNRLYRQQKFDKAEIDYSKATDKNQANAQALYNLGCAYMQQQKDSAAIVQFENAGKLEKSKMRKAMAYHNIGVICQAHQMFAEAIEAYKESLRNNPKDNETRYNLALCQRQLKNQNNKDKNKQDDEKKKDENGKDEKKEQDKQDKDKKQDPQQQQQQQEKMSKENAEQMLQAVMQNEKNTQQKLKKQQAQSKNRNREKNW